MARRLAPAYLATTTAPTTAHVSSAVASVSGYSRSATERRTTRSGRIGRGHPFNFTFPSSSGRLVIVHVEKCARPHATAGPRARGRISVTGALLARELFDNLAEPLDVEFGVLRDQIDPRLRALDAPDDRREQHRDGVPRPLFAEVGVTARAAEAP